MADVTLTYKGSPILELSASGQKSINTQGTFCDANILLDYVKSSGGSVQYKSGTYTATSDQTSYMIITTVADVGFTPKAFIFVANDRSDLSGAGTVLLCAMYAQSPTGNDYRASIRYSNASNQIGGSWSGDALTNNSGTVLYLSSSGNISFHASAAYMVKGNVQFSWYAFDW